MSEIVESLLMSHAYGLEKLKGEFIEIVSMDAPTADKEVAAALLLTEAIEQFETFLAGAKERAKTGLVPEPKDEVIIGKVRIVHRMQKGKKLDGPAWDAACLADDKLAGIQANANKASEALKKAQQPYKLPSTWIEFKAAKK